MMNKAESTRVVIRPDDAPTTLRIRGDVGSILRATCTWKSASHPNSESGNISTQVLPDPQIRFGLGASAFGSPPVVAIQQLGESLLIDGIPWWTPAEKPMTSHCECGQTEMLTPFLITWDKLDSAWASLDSSSSLPLVNWYESLLEHPSLKKNGAITVEIVTQVPTKQVVDKYMCRAPLAQNNNLSNGQLITDPDLIDTYFQRNAIRRTVPTDMLCTMVMIGVVIDPVTFTARWGNGILQRGFYVTPGMKSHAKVIQHTHAAVIPNSRPIDRILQLPLQSIDSEIAAITQETLQGKHRVYITHIENDTRLSQAIARVGIVNNIEV